LHRGYNPAEIQNADGTFNHSLGRLRHACHPPEKWIAAGARAGGMWQRPVGATSCR